MGYCPTNGKRSLLNKQTSQVSQGSYLNAGVLTTDEIQTLKELRDHRER